MKKSSTKITRSHSTSIESVDPFLKLAQNSPEVTKISLGIIKPVKTAQRKRIKCTLERACVRAQVTGNRAIQEIRFFTNKLEDFRNKLDQEAHLNGFEVSR